jgi:hypothetical protein
VIELIFNFIQIGKRCRAKCTAPARYIGFGKCLYVSAMTNELCVDWATPPKGNESKLPLPSFWDVMKFAVKEEG